MLTIVQYVNKIIVQTWHATKQHRAWPPFKIPTLIWGVTKKKSKKYRTTSAEIRRWRDCTVGSNWSILYKLDHSEKLHEN
jgi:hypothetical protein